MKEKEKTFLICPVRGANLKIQEPIVEELEKNYQVYWPPRDTHQNDPTGLVICQENLKAMKEASVVHVIWNGKSQGSLFDLGMAFALEKSIIPISLPSPTHGKSFQAMIIAWRKEKPFKPPKARAATEEPNATTSILPEVQEKEKSSSATTGAGDGRGKADKKEPEPGI